MREIEILLVGKHPEIMATIARLINKKQGWQCSCVSTCDEAFEQATAFDLVLLGAGLTEHEAMQLRDRFIVPVIQHYGGGSGLLYAEIYQALDLPAHAV